MTKINDGSEKLRLFLTVAGLLSGLVFTVRPTLAFPPPAADRVIGQPDFLTNTCNTGGPDAGSLCFARGVQTDAAGNLYVADSDNGRVFEFDDPLTTDMVADRVFGQPDFTTVGCNTGGRSAISLCSPQSAALDAAGNLYVSDTGNNRVLVYFSPLTTDAVADIVIGQPDFSTSIEAAPSRTTFYYPRGVALDSAGNLYVGDAGFARVLEFDSPLITDLVADRVFGQPDFTSFDWIDEVSARTVGLVIGLDLDASDNLYAGDILNNRVLVYLNPLATDAVADMVIGQPDFTSFGCNNGGMSAGSLCHPRDVAIDAAGNLYISELQFDVRTELQSPNNRVLEYDSPLTTDTVADRVYGQPNFITGGCNSGGVSAGSLCWPHDVALNSAGNLFVADWFNSRVLEFDQPLFPIPDADGDDLADFYDACPYQDPAGLDADHDGCVDTLAGLKLYVEGLAIDTIVKNGLLAKLAEAQKALNRGKEQIAINKLQDFINQVESQRGKALANWDADVLTNYANNLISTYM